MLITALLPDGRSVQLGVAENTLVFDGLSFANPSDVSWIELYTIPVSAMSMPYKDVLSQALTAEVRIRASVLEIDNTVVPVTDPSVVASLDPSNGECICGITCNGTDIRFANVHYLEN